MRSLAGLKGLVLVLHGVKVMLVVNLLLAQGLLKLFLHDVAVDALDVPADLLAVLASPSLLFLEGCSVSFGLLALLSKVGVIVLMVLLLLLPHASLVGVAQILHLEPTVLLLELSMNLVSLDMALHVFNFLASLLYARLVSALAVLHLHV